MISLFRILVTFVVCSNMVSAYMKEPECTCSKFHYEEQLLEKMIRTELKFQALQKQLDAKMDGFTNTLEDMSTSMNERLDSFRKSDDFMETRGGFINSTVSKIEKLTENVEGKNIKEVSLYINVMFTGMSGVKKR